MPSLIRTKAGFTLTEIIIALAILVLISAIAFNSLMTNSHAQALENDTGRVLSLIERARTMTLNSKAGSQYGVHLEASKAVLFKGTVYSAGDPANQAEDLNPTVSISGLALAAGGSEIVFDRLNGKTGNFGTITLSLLSDPTASDTITVYGTGLTERSN